MKCSDQPAGNSAEIACDHIQAAHRHVQDMQAENVDLLQPPTLDELGLALGEKAKSCQLLGQNWRNRVYRVDLASGRTVVAKQLVVGTDAMLQYQYDQHGALAKLQIPKLRVPKALALLRAKRVYLMELAHGKTIEALVWNRATTNDLLRACQLAGEILAKMHIASTEKVCRMPIREIARDLATAPWHLRSRERQILESALQSLARAEISVGAIYYDYKPANLLFENDALFHLIDPPDVFREGVHLWDFSLFRSSMRRHLWGFSLRHPFDRRRAIIKESLRAFERAYLAGFGSKPPEFFAVAAWLFELQRTGQRMTMQRGKVYFAGRPTQTWPGYLLHHRLAHRLTLPLLNMEKRWLFLQLARVLPR
jgi:Ser/Thr protein kinase RdoA (MazF antagonist)